MDKLNDMQKAVIDDVLRELMNLENYPNDIDVNKLSKKWKMGNSKFANLPTDDQHLCIATRCPRCPAWGTFSLYRNVNGDLYREKCPNVLLVFV